jgi:Domain of unknown function (DUF5666)
VTRLLHFIGPRAAWRSAVLAAIIAAGCVQVPATGLSAGATGKAGAPANACDAAAQVNPLAAGAAVAGRPGLGGTGIDTGGDAVAGRPGLGGTGIDTGGVGGTGIVGVITGFASVCVNGVEVHYDQSTPVASNGALSSASQLAVGQVVLIAAQGKGTQLTARSINAVYAVVGPVQSMDAQQGTVQVMGQQLVDATAAEMGRVQPGQWVQASGHRLANGAVALTSLEPIAALDQARLNGRITRIEPGAVVVEGTRVVLGQGEGAQPLPAGAAVGMELSVNGVWDGTQLQGQRLDAEPTRKALGSSERVVLQGYVQGLRGRELNLGYSVVTLGAGMQIVGGGKQGLAVNQRVQVSGRIGSDKRFTVDRVEVQNSGSSGSGKGSGRRGDDNSGSGKSGDDSGKNSGSDSSNSGKGSSDSGSGSNSGSSNSGSGSSGNSGKGSSGGGGSSGGSGGGSGGGGSGGGGSGGGSSGGGSSGGSGRGGGSSGGGGK